MASQGTSACAGSGRAANLGSFSPQGDFVDAHTAINDIKEDSTGYFAPIYSELSRLSRIDPITNRMTHCIGSCKRIKTDKTLIKFHINSFNYSSPEKGITCYTRVQTTLQEKQHEAKSEYFILISI